MESEDTGYGAQFSYEDKKKDKKKVSMRSKKSKNNQLGSDAVRWDGMDILIVCIFFGREYYVLKKDSL